MKAILLAVSVLDFVNERLLKLGRIIGIGCVAVMVAAILIQVFFRYVLNNALPWPDEAARFCMLWMTGLMAPAAFRVGGFVAIDTLESMLLGPAATLLSLFLLALSLIVLVFAAQIGFHEVTGLGGRFATASLYFPTSIMFDSWYHIPRSWMMASLFVGMCLLISVNLELILRRIAALLGHENALPVIQGEEIGGAE